MFLETLLLFGAGVAGGMLNSIAGGGSFITFPALLFAGLPPVSANATNTFASCSGYLSGCYAFRKDIAAHRDELPKFIVVSLMGGIGGAWLLMHTPDALFREVVPWLLLFATLLFIFGEQINRFLKGFAGRHRHAGLVGRLLLLLLLLGVSLYGGFFNAGLGVISLSYLALAGYTDIHTMNGLKLLISSIISLIAIALFMTNDLIAWQAGSSVLLGTLLGGYLSAHLSRRLPQRQVRFWVAVACILITLYFFYAVYAG